MPRRREVPKREILPDPLYNSQLVTKFVNVVMKDGKKTVAERLLYDALELIHDFPKRRAGNGDVLRQLRLGHSVVAVEAGQHAPLWACEAQMARAVLE